MFFVNRRHRRAAFGSARWLWLMDDHEWRWKHHFMAPYPPSFDTDGVE